MPQRRISPHGSPRHQAPPIKATGRRANLMSKTVQSNYPSPAFETNCTHRRHNYEQNIIWYQDAVRRVGGRSTLQRPTVDRLHYRGRTIYDVQSSFIPEAAATPSLDQGRRYHKISIPKLSRRRSLIDETLHQVENGKTLRKLSPAFALDIITAAEVVPVPLIQMQDKCNGESGTTERRLSTPSLTWSDTPGDRSDTEEALIERPFGENAPLEPRVVVDSFPGRSASFWEEYRINPPHALGLGYMLDQWPLMGHPSRHCAIAGDRRGSFESADEFFEMFVNTEDCKDMY